MERKKVDFAPGKCVVVFFVFCIFCYLYAPVNAAFAYRCPQMCVCEKMNTLEDGRFNSDDGEEDFSKISCHTGGMNDYDLAQILARIPETVRVINIEAPSEHPNNFKMSEDFGRFYDLEELRLVNCGIISLGRAVFSRNKNLRRLVLSDNKIRELSPSCFEGMENLQHLDLSRNRLYENYLLTGTFSYLKNVRTLILSENRVRHFSSNVFGQLDRLHTLNLDYNSPNASQMHVLHDLPNLQSLSMAGCQLTRLEPWTFSGNARLKRLVLRGNNLRTLDAEALKNVPLLEELDFSYNDIRQLNDYALSAFTNLQKLNLAGNRLCVSDEKGAKKITFSPRAFERTNLTVVDLSDNGFDASFSPAEALGDSSATVKTLILSRNRFEKIAPTLTNGLTSLSELHLSDIGLTRLPSVDEHEDEQETWPTEFHNLRLLNLSGNRLERDVFRRAQILRRLTVLDLSNCDFTQPPPAHFLQYAEENLRTVYLNDNPWRCDCDISQFRDLLRNARQRSSQNDACHEWRLARILCASPPALNRTAVAVAIPLHCEDPNSSSAPKLIAAPTQRAAHSEVGILIAGVCAAIFIVVAIIIGLACNQLRQRASYRTHEDKVNLSGATANAGNQENDENAQTVGGSERLF